MHWLVRGQHIDSLCACVRACARAREEKKIVRGRRLSGRLRCDGCLCVSNSSQALPRLFIELRTPPLPARSAAKFFSVHPPYFGFKVHYRIRLYTPFFGSKCYSVHVRNIVEDGIYTAAAADGVRLRHCQTHWSRVHSHALTAHCIAVCCYWQLLLLRSASLELSDWLCVYRYCSFLLL